MINSSNYNNNYSSSSKKEIFQLKKEDFDDVRFTIPSSSQFRYQVQISDNNLDEDLDIDVNKYEEEDDFYFDSAFMVWQDRMLILFPEKFTLQNTYYEIVKYLFIEFDTDFILLFTSIIISIEENTKLNKNQLELIYGNNKKKIALTDSFMTRLIQIFSIREFEELFFDYLLN